MGATHSTPPPLVEISAPNGKVLVPPGTAFTVHPPPPPPYHRTRSAACGRRPGQGPGPVFLPVGPQTTRRRGYMGEGSEGSEEGSEMVVRRGLGMGMGMGQNTRAGYPPGLERGRGASGMGDGFAYAGGMVPGAMSPNMRGLGMYGGMGGAGYGGMGMADMGPSGVGGFNGMPPLGRPPEYSSDPNIARFPGGEGPPRYGVNPYTSYPGLPASPPSSSRSPSSPGPRPSEKNREDFESVPMGAYTGAKKSRKPGRSHGKEKVSDQLNRGQFTDRKVGPSGKEWIKGNDFLDACMCTTNCTCRKSERVLYRKMNRREGNGSDSEETTYDAGEIRYVLKGDLGRDCGDHSGCKKSDSSENEKEATKKSKKKKQKEEKTELQGFKNDLLDAIDERLKNHEKGCRPAERPASPLWPQFGNPGHGPSPFAMETPSFDPRMAKQMNIGMSGGPYGLGMPESNMLPNGMPSGMDPRSIRGNGFPMSGMKTAGVTFEDEMPMAGMNGMGPTSLGNPYATGDFTTRNAMRPGEMMPRRASAQQRFRRNDATMYPRPSFRKPTGLRADKPDERRSRQFFVDSESDEFDMDPRTVSGRGRASHGGVSFAQGARGTKENDQDGDIRGLSGHSGSSSAGKFRRQSSFTRGRQPHADTDDEDAY
ncbi:hypothetical protein ACN47E_007274 [Coniothyrium glycines]